VPFRHGGVVTRPTIFPFAGGIGLMSEAGPEAIMPLRRLGGGDVELLVAEAWLVQFAEPPDLRPHHRSVVFAHRLALNVLP
jgi:hypothetical protein